MTEIRVEIFYVQGKMMMFDFGYFGIVIEYNQKKKEDKFDVYRGESYSKKFMDDWMQEVSNLVDEVRVSPDVFRRIKNVFLNREKLKNNDLWSVLRESFPKQIRSYGR